MERTRYLLDRKRPVTERYQRCLETLEEIKEEKEPNADVVEMLKDVLDFLWEDMTPEQQAGFKPPHVAS